MKLDPFDGNEAVTYVVKGEHTLGYVHPRQPLLMGILGASIIAGGHNWRDGLTYLGDDYRPATPQDFERFRVMEPPYNWRGQ